MACISRLKDTNYLINFDEARIYCDGEIVVEIKSATHLRILNYLSINPMIWLSRDAIIKQCWPDPNLDDKTFYSTISKLRSIHAEVYNSIESQKGKGYRYLGHKQECCDITSMPKEQNTPTPPIGISQEVLAYDALLSEIEYLSHQIYSLVENMEEIQRKITIATNSKNMIWEGIYETQFKAVYFQFNRFQLELTEKQNQLEKVKHLTQRCDGIMASGGHSPTVIACIPAPDMVVFQEVRNMESEVSELHRNAAVIANELDIILDYIERISN